MGGLSLSIPPNLLPPFSSTPLYCQIHLHDPVDLTLAILQPVRGDEERDLDTTVDASALLRRFGSESKIWREGMEITSASSGLDSTAYRILMLEPVQQGIITPATKIIISTEPYLRPSPLTNGYSTNYNDSISESSHGQTHLSLADFDPDAFMSSSLTLSYTDKNLDEDPAQSIHSFTSGSTTPKPNGTPRSASPPAATGEVSGDEEEQGGVRFTAVVAAGGGEDGDNDDVCWVGVGGLGRAGIFEGDWVSCRNTVASLY
jgi:peroxin-6